jgi:hypothetical protein
MRFLFTCFLASITTLFSNPFLIDFENKQGELSSSDWCDLQDKLRAIDIAPTLDKIYPDAHKNVKTWFKKPELKEQSDFLGRMSRGTRQTLINQELKKLPIKELIKVNQGGDCCIVSFASYDGVYVDQLKGNLKELEKTGWNGNFLLMAGGFPNPTGKELCYAGVPYCFKIFALLEAKKLGFEKVLWIDAAMQPIQNPRPLFEHIEKTGSFFQVRKNSKRYLLPFTQEILLKETGIDMYETKSVRARIIGLNFKMPQVKRLVEEYYHLVKIGTPFMSCFPEEHVLGALIAKYPDQFSPEKFDKLVKNERKLHGKTTKWVEKNEYFFLLKDH